MVTRNIEVRGIELRGAVPTVIEYVTRRSLRRSKPGDAHPSADRRDLPIPVRPPAEEAGRFGDDDQ